jgi:hypothetical protein
MKTATIDHLLNLPISDQSYRNRGKCKVEDLKRRRKELSSCIYSMFLMGSLMKKWAKSAESGQKVG